VRLIISTLNFFFIWDLRCNVRDLIEKIQSRLIFRYKIRSKLTVRILSKQSTYLCDKLNNLQKITNLFTRWSTSCKIKLFVLIQEKEKYIINFFELAAIFPRSDGRVTIQCCRHARLHPRQPWSIYFSHDTSKEPVKDRRSTREKSNYYARKYQVLCESRTAPLQHRSSYLLWNIVFSYNSASRMIANFFQWFPVSDSPSFTNVLDSNRWKWSKEDRDPWFYTVKYFWKYLFSLRYTHNSVDYNFIFLTLYF